MACTIDSSPLVTKTINGFKTGTGCASGPALVLQTVVILAPC